MTLPTLGAEIDDARERHFVGREAELARLDALCRPDGPAVAYLHGPGGVGKSELLQICARRWQRLGAAVARVDAQAIVGNERGFLDAIRTAEVALGRRADILIVDSVDHVWHLERWLRDVYLPSLPVTTRLVMGGRDPLDASWRASPAWRTRLDSISLANLSRDEVIAYLEIVGVSERHHEAIYRGGFGHPLATALLAEVGLQCDGAFPHLGRLPDIVQTVLSRLLRGVLDHTQRLALWCAALVPVLSEQLLSRMMPDEFESGLFEWIRARPFVRMNEHGLVLHDLARAALTADVQWRAPDMRRTLVERALDEYLRRMEPATNEVVPTAQSVIATMQLYGHHVSRAVRNDYYPSPLLEGDWPKLEAMVERHEGRTAAGLARFWRDRGAEITVARHCEGEPAGCVITVWLDRISRRDAARDPGVLPTFDHLDGLGVLDRGRAYLVRFWMGRDSYQSFDSPVAGVLMTRILTHPFTDGMTFGLTAHGDPASARAVAPSLQHFENCGFELGDRTYRVMGYDFRDDPPAAWFRRILTTTIRKKPAHRLDRRTFEDAVRAALKSIRQVDRLATNPLLRSGLAAGIEPGSSKTAAAERLQALLQSEIDGLANSEFDSATHRVLATTYLGRPTKQIAAAAKLGMSYSTYRRRHGEAVDRLVEILWLRDGVAGHRAVGLPHPGRRETSSR